MTGASQPVDGAGRHCDIVMHLVDGDYIPKAVPAWMVPARVET